MAIQPISFPTGNISSPTLSGFTSGFMLPDEILKQQLANKIAQIQAKYEEPKTIEELQKAKLLNQIYGVQAKYAEPLTEQELKKAQLYNQYYGPNIESEIGLRGAETNKINTLLPQELISSTLANRSSEQSLSQGNTPNQFGRPGSNITAFDRMPASYKDASLAQAISFGFNPTDAYKLFRQGKSLGDIAQMKGYSIEGGDWPNASFPATQATKTQAQRSTMAKAGLDISDDFINKGLSNYVGEPTFNKVPLGFYKDALTGKNKDKQSDFIASTVLAQDQAFLRARQAGAPLSQGLLQHTLETSLSNVKASYPFVSQDVFLEAGKKIKKAFDDINYAETKSISSLSKANRKDISNSEISEADINYTAKKWNMTTDQVIKKLKDQGRL